MLSDFGLLISTLVDIMKVELTLYGFTFSMWQILLFNLVAGMIAWILWEVFLGG